MPDLAKEDVMYLTTITTTDVLDKVIQPASKLREAFVTELSKNSRSNVLLLELCIRSLNTLYVGINTISLVCEYAGEGGGVGKRYNTTSLLGCGRLSFQKERSFWQVREKKSKKVR